MKKILSLLVMLLCVISLAGCLDLTEISSLEFANAPKGEYTTQDTTEKANQFSVKAVVNGEDKIMKLDNPELTVTGLNGDYIDVSSLGNHVIKVTYKGLTISFNYVVTGTKPTTTSWKDYTSQPALAGNVYTVTKPQELAWLSVNASQLKDKTVKVTQPINLDGHEWTPINVTGATNFTFTCDSNVEISGLRITDAAKANGVDPKYGGDIQCGLFGLVGGKVTIENVTLKDVTINAPDNKCFGALMGEFEGGELSVNNVRVENANIFTMGRSAILIGRTQGQQTTSITNITILNSSITANNPVTIAIADGEGDKIGGIIGQDNSYGSMTIDHCDIQVSLSGTRDIAGVVAFLQQNHTNHARTVSITNCHLMAGSVIAASVPGGMLQAKSTRNVGGVIATVLSHNGSSNVMSLSIADITIDPNVVILTNALYEDSSMSKYIGGYRGESGLNLNLTVGTNKLEHFNGAKVDKKTLANYSQYLADQATFVQAVDKLFEPSNK